MEVQMSKPDTIKIDEVEYVRKDRSSLPASPLNGLPYVICRTQSAGVFAGYLKQRQGQEVTLLHARRLWYWAGAASLSQAAQSGFSRPDACKFPCEVTQVLLLQAVEILNCTQEAQVSIASVKIWKV